MGRTNGRTTRFPEVTDHASTARFAADVQYYLAQSPRQLPSRYFYDELGSALFEAICRLPWYGLMRAESRLLAAHGRDIFKRLASLTTIVELGSGSGDKMRMLIEAADPPQPALTVHLVDVSLSALEASARMLAALVDPSLITEHPNYLRMAFHPLGARRSIVNWDEVARHLLGRAQRELEFAKDDETAVALLQELREYAGLAIRQRESTPLSAGDLLLPIHFRKDGLELRLFSTIMTLGTPTDVTLQELRIETFFPADAASERAWTSLAA